MSVESMLWSLVLPANQSLMFQEPRLCTFWAQTTLDMKKFQRMPSLFTKDIQAMRVLIMPILFCQPLVTWRRIQPMSILMEDPNKLEHVCLDQGSHKMTGWF